MARARQVQPQSHALHTQAHPRTHTSDTTRMHARTHARTHAPSPSQFLSHSVSLAAALSLACSLSLALSLSLARSLRVSLAHAWRHTSTRHARPKYPCAPCHSRAHTRTRNQACLRLNIPMHEYTIIIIIIITYYIFWLPRARPNVLIFCGCAPYLRVGHAAGNHSSSAMSPAASCPPRISRCIACHASRQCVGQCEKAFSMRFEIICTRIRMPSPHAA